MLNSQIVHSPSEIRTPTTLSRLETSVYSWLISAIQLSHKNPYQAGVGKLDPSKRNQFTPTKYVDKGHDCARAEVVNSADEILSYVTGRYVSATESIWRIHSFKMYDPSHSMMYDAMMNGIIPCLIIWDEATIATGDIIKCASECVSDACRSKVVLFSGDYRECLPVTRGGSRIRIVENSTNKRRLWTNFRVFTLTQNIRAEQDRRGFAASSLVRRDQREMCDLASFCVVFL